MSIESLFHLSGVRSKRIGSAQCSTYARTFTHKVTNKNEIHNNVYRSLPSWSRDCWTRPHLPACRTSWNGDIPCVLVRPDSIREIMFFWTLTGFSECEAFVENLWMNTTGSATESTDNRSEDSFSLMKFSAAVLLISSTGQWGLFLSWQSGRIPLLW